MESTITLVLSFTLELILVSVLEFLLWNFITYLKNKSPGQQTLLDGAYTHLFQYFGMLHVSLTLVSICYEVSDHQVNQYLAYILVATSFWIQQLFCYQLLICALVRLGIVLHVELPASWADDFVHRRIRIALTLVSLSVVVAFSIYFDSQFGMVMILQGHTNFDFKVRFQPIIWGITLIVQFVSRIIVRFKVGFENNEGPSKELINTQTLLFIVLSLISTRTFLRYSGLRYFQYVAKLGHCLTIVVELQILFHSEALRQYFKQKYQSLIPDLNASLEQLLAIRSRWFKNSVNPSSENDSQSH